ncbi:5-oxoprolinase subunit PxpB [Maribacter chungangensis]|uniref:5-oxoprolinase subunit PxpB n=1 Tax=Maribacter chungangensis TaxID=1069117 RepID=A0ABW3B2V7_9FLAO
MIFTKIHTKPFGPHAVLVVWPSEVSELILNRILQFENFLKNQCLEGSDWEYVPAYNSLLVVNKKVTLDYLSFSEKLRNWYLNMGEIEPYERYLWRLPVSYEKEFGIDLEELSSQLKIDVDEIIALHTNHIYTVYGIGFLPGFMYLGGLPKLLETTRKDTPRMVVEKGAVGIAGKQTGIYPQESPGGWNIIGNCPVPIFDTTKKEPCFVSVGDQIQFYEVSRAKYNLHRIEVEVGIFQPEKIKIDA